MAVLAVLLSIPSKKSNSLIHGSDMKAPAILNEFCHGACPLCRWSAGVIMYTLLAGSPPFWHRKQMLMLRMILAGDYSFSSPEWDDRSDTVKDLVSHFN